MSYNVLSDDLMKWHKNLYTHIPKHMLEWEFRWNRILQQVRHYRPDILCLQEVQSDQLDRFYASDLSKLGYKGVYKQRTGDKGDGCAVFYKWKKFQLEDFVCVEFHQPRIPVLNRDNVAILAKFKPASGGGGTSSFVVATTHILFNMKRSEIKLAQMALLLAELDRFARPSSAPPPPNEMYLPTIVTGDFNMPPDSPIVSEFVQRGSVALSMLTSTNRRIETLLPPCVGVTDWCQHVSPENRLKNNSRQAKLCDGKKVVSDDAPRVEPRPIQLNAGSMDAFGSGVYRHRFGFKSVYKNTAGQEASAHKGGGDYHVVDYMMYSSKFSPEFRRHVEGKLKLVSRLSLPSEKTCREMGGLPNPHCPSDHICLMANFLLT